MPNPRKTAGTTLIEINLAMGVLLFGVLSVAALFPTGLTLAERGIKTTDSAIITSMAKSQLEILRRSDGFRYPNSTYKNNREALVGATPANVTRNVFSCKKDGNDDPAGGPLWTAGAWANKYILMTSGFEAGKIYQVQSNTQDMITLVGDLVTERLRKDDSFRIIYNSGGTQCIPEGFLARGETIPTINGLALDRIKRELGRDVTPSDLPNNSALMLDQRGYCRYSYAILLDGPEGSSGPDLFRAFVLVYKDFDSTITPAREWWKNKPPAEYYPFFYRRR
ncbi:MAG: hypothetical protein HQ592_11505 [Planctomycetes bacterium]|nr:hypothetical protein [Planctomycetota bacterium]